MTDYVHEVLLRRSKVVLDQYGKGLGRTQFNDVVIGVFENVAGLDGLPGAEVRKLLASVWRCYRK